jgi:hypothetical protein
MKITNEQKRKIDTRIMTALMQATSESLEKRRLPVKRSKK